jgi:site-specific recombinase XerC
VASRDRLLHLRQQQKPINEDKITHLVAGQLEVFGIVGKPLPTSCEAGMALEAVQAQAGHRSIESTRVYLHLANDWLADQYLRAAELIDADTAAVAEMLAMQEVAAR